MGLAPTFKRCALLCAILGAHCLLLALLHLNHNRRGMQNPEEPLGVLFIVELPTPNDSQPPADFDAPSLESKAAGDNAIALPPQIEETDAFIDWDAEASRVAGDAARRTPEKKQFRSLDSHPPGMRPSPPGSSDHKLGDSQHFEGGEIVTWIGKGCYYSNQNMPIPAFGQALRLQLPTCTGAGTGGGPPLQTFEEWKIERDSRR